MIRFFLLFMFIIGNAAYGDHHIETSPTIAIRNQTNSTQCFCILDAQTKGEEKTSALIECLKAGTHHRMNINPKDAQIIDLTPHQAEKGIIVYVSKGEQKWLGCKKMKNGDVVTIKQNYLNGTTCTLHKKMLHIKWQQRVKRAERARKFAAKNGSHTLFKKHKEGKKQQKHSLESWLHHFWPFRKKDEKPRQPLAPIETDNPLLRAKASV